MDCVGQSGCGLEKFQRLVELAQAAMHFAQVAQVHGLMGIQSHGLRDQPRSRLVAAGLAVEHSQKMQGVGVLRIGCQDLSIELLRFLPAGALLLDRELQDFG